MPDPLGPDDFPVLDRAKVELGQLLFYDPILSGNQNISCAVCHISAFGGSDGLSLGIGEGGQGLGPDRTPGINDSRIKKRIPRNSMALWNLGANEIHTLFHDGRLSKSNIFSNGFNNPAEEWFPKGLESILAAQSLLPMISQFEMAGNPKENQVAGAIHDRIDAAWPIIAKRVRVNPTYASMFLDAFGELNDPKNITIVHIGNVLGQFMDFEWRSFDSRFDQWQSGNEAALSHDQLSGMDLFYGKAKCSSCHSGKLFTDQKFHALAVPQFGPGRTRRFDPAVRDVGHMGESDRLEDAYRFRTPSLRNVALTGPYGHNGAFPTLEGIVRHHLNPLESLKTWQPSMANLPSVHWLEKADFLILDNQREQKRLKSKIDIEPILLSDKDVGDLIAFLHALTGTESIKGRLGKPETVPSGLKVE